MLNDTLDLVQPACIRLERGGLFGLVDRNYTTQAEEILEDLIENTEQEVDQMKEDGLLDLDDPILEWTKEYQ